VSAPPAVTTVPWEKVDEWSEVAFENRFVTVKSVNAVYEDPAFLERFRPLMAADINQLPRAVRWRTSQMQCLGRW
jgi:hypothetical protein